MFIRRKRLCGKFLLSCDMKSPAVGQGFSKSCGEGEIFGNYVAGQIFLATGLSRWQLSREERKADEGTEFNQ